MENWIGTVVGKMHIHGISQSDLAAVLGIRRDYLNKILNGRENPANAKANITNALNELIESRKEKR